MWKKIPKSNKNTIYNINLRFFSYFDVLNFNAKAIFGAANVYLYIYLSYSFTYPQSHDKNGYLCAHKKMISMRQSYATHLISLFLHFFPRSAIFSASYTKRGYSEELDSSHFNTSVFVRLYVKYVCVNVWFWFWTTRRETYIIYIYNSGIQTYCLYAHKYITQDNKLKKTEIYCIILANDIYMKLDKKLPNVFHLIKIYYSIYVYFDIPTLFI